jgi:hypothetical protein
MPSFEGTRKGRGLVRVLVADRPMTAKVLCGILFVLYTGIRREWLNRARLRLWHDLLAQATRPE